MSITFHVTITHELGQATKGWFMSILGDAIAKVTASVDAATARVQADMVGLRDQIAKLQALVDSGGASAADMQALADLQAKADAIDPTVAATLPV
jgi:hypothetical protein